MIDDEPISKLFGMRITRLLESETR